MSKRTVLARAGAAAADLEMHLRLVTLKEAALILMAILAAGAVTFAGFYLQSSGRGSNWGLGSDWECSSPGKGGPVCIKRPGKPDDPPTPAR